MLSSLLIEKIFDEAYSFFKKSLKSEGNKYTIKKADIEDALQSHLKYVDLWSKEIYMREMLEGKKTNKSYIGLNISVAHRKLIPKTHKSKKKYILNIINDQNNIILLGDPGAGKTTTLKYLCQKLIHSDLKSLNNFMFPLVIPLRNLSENETIYDRLRHIFGIHLFWGEKEITLDGKLEKDENIFLKRIINEYIDNLNVLVLIDGLDELMPLKAQREIKFIRELSTSLKYSKLILTCRSGAYNIKIDNTKVYEICALDNRQIDNFCKKWFSNKKKAEQFIIELKESPLSDTANRPLILALLCSIYSKYLRLPDKPKFIYQKIIRLLIEDWDIQREIKRVSDYNPIDSDKIFDFLTKFAFELTVSYSKKEYSYEEIKIVLNDVFNQYEIPINEAEKFLLDIETRNGIFIKSSYDTFEFYHKSIQEYLSAEYILRLPKVPTEIIYSYVLPNELAIAVCLSSNATVYFCNLVLNIFVGIDSKRETVQYGITNGSLVALFLERLLIEKPDFEISPLLSYAFLFLEHHYNLGNPSSLEDIEDNYESHNDNYIEGYQNYFSEFSEINTVKRSFEQFNDYILNRRVEKDIHGNVYLELEIDVNMYLRNFEVNAIDKLYVNRKLFRSVLQ